MLEDIRSFILADATVASLVATRMYAHLLPQQPTLPALSYTIVSEVRGYDLGGVDGVPATRIQIDSWDTTMAGAIALDAAVLARIDGYRGAMGSPPTTIQGVFVDVVRSSFESEPMLHRISRDYFIHYEV